MKEIKLTYEDVEKLQHILRDYMTCYKNMSKQYCDVIEALSLKLVAMRAQMEYLKKRESE